MTSVSCPRCHSERFINKAGHTRQGIQLYKCIRCKCRFIEHHEKKVQFGERMPWPEDYFSELPHACSPIVDAGMERGNIRRRMPEKPMA